MKNIFIKVLLIFTFILCSVVTSFAVDENTIPKDYGINSVTFDDSGNFFSINSGDSENYSLEVNPKLFIVEDENKAFFDLPNAVLKSSKQNLVIKSDCVNEIIVSQHSANPNIVRVVIHYNPEYNPRNIKLKRVNETFFVTFKNPTISNYYFQEIYNESGVKEQFESTEIQPKIIGMQNIFKEINASFSDNGNQNSAQNDEQNFILTNKDLYLQSKYYINDINFKGSMPVIIGLGNYILSKPIYLSSPSRVAYDVYNAVVNPSIRNKEISFGNNSTIKIGQFDKSTARIVLTDNHPERYVPVIYGDMQKLVFFDTKTTPLNLYSTLTDLNAITYEKPDGQFYSFKMVFSKPLIYGINRTSKSLDLMLYNLNNYYEGAMSSELRDTPFGNFTIKEIKGGGAKLSIPLEKADMANIFLGSDGKTLRIKSKILKPAPQKEEPLELKTPEIVVPLIEKIPGKKYVVIDPGHGGSDVGATRNNVYEKDIVLDMSKRVEKLLTKKGYIVKMTRKDDATVSLQERVDFSESIQPDVYVSIHVNSSNSDTPTGIETHYYKENSLELAKYVHASMLNNVNAKDRGLFKSKFYVINHTTSPAILVETGFISNPSERAQLVTESRKNATAKAIAEGIDEYLKK